MTETGERTPSALPDERDSARGEPTDAELVRKELDRGAACGSSVVEVLPRLLMIVAGALTGKGAEALVLRQAQERPLGAVADWDRR